MTMPARKLPALLRQRLAVDPPGLVMWLDPDRLYADLASTAVLESAVLAVSRSTVLGTRVLLAAPGTEVRILYCPEPAGLEPLEEIIQCFATSKILRVEELLLDAGVQADSNAVALSRRYPSALLVAWDKIGEQYWQSGDIDLGVALALWERDRGDEIDLVIDMLRRSVRPLNLGLNSSNNEKLESADRFVAALITGRFGFKTEADVDMIAKSLIAHDLLSIESGELIVGHLVTGQRRDWIERCIGAVANDHRLRELLRGVLERAVRELHIDVGELPLSSLMKLRIVPGIDEMIADRLDALISQAGEELAFDRLKEFDSGIRRRGLSPYADAISFYNAVETGRTRLSEGTDSSAFFTLYATQWSVIDRLYRRIAGRVKGALQRAVDTRYRLWLRDLNVAFGNSLAGLPTWAFQHSQRQLGKSFAKVSGRNAIIVSDALRYEMAADLFDRISKGTKSLDWAVAAVPTKTEVGMSALLPTEDPLRLEVQEKSLVVRVGNRVTTDKSARDPIWQAAGYVVFSDVGIRNANTDGLERVVVFHGAIDALGEKLQANAFEHYDMLIEELVRLTSDLAKRGFRVTVTADHGFLTLPPNSSSPIVAGANNDDVKKRRYRVGAMEPLPEPAMSRSAAELGMEGDVIVSFPPAASVFSAHGALVFLHGGLSLQEMVIPLLVIDSKPLVQGGLGFTVAFPKKLRGRAIAVSVKRPSAGEDAMSLQLVARTGGAEVTASSAIDRDELGVKLSVLLPDGTADGPVELTVMMAGGRVIDRKVVEYESHE